MKKLKIILEHVFSIFIILSLAFILYTIDNRLDALEYNTDTKARGSDFATEIYNFRNKVQKT